MYNSKVRSKKKKGKRLVQWLADWIPFESSCQLCELPFPDASFSSLAGGRQYQS